ncbi:hypothetical protein GE21DRAFT_9093 [Neurospora crassa]|uniref:C2H2-type domain-containing protein n=1 Tax=Neurospora crassa (strain ATCC 24698 / 74-OR23-1A / CBS 708.71 / DSM 1257 / FGSC 987) TaxID=367110 RepID=Q7RXH2_NEUCR|nr:hypothetical protein NCU03878 [Neurospora crassa OR74A]EAA27315.2 hypothetical protein NCU03878 [Neurospora crassa OR74A]KHE80779.1 hypothetical protein GE21DRAFT_9093 [Neurospora crassa]|eukprot:XP_956551.2 hypothetical protein NCU03878 [Neurospora crassa OR74A]
MASLKFIMDVNDDHTESHHINKKDVASDHPVNMGHPHRPPLHTQLPSLPPTTLPPITLPRYDSNPGPSIQPRDISLAVASSQTKSPDISWGSKGVNPVVSSIPLAVHIRSTMRRRSTASNDSADHTTGFGSASTSSTGGNYPQSHTPLRPMRSQSHTSELPMRLTPITGRVSRAKKGIPVHVCDICRPSKTFTRAEHLRRHQLGHGPPEYSCPYPNCDKAFHRSDLLVRHQQRHEQEGDKVLQTVSGDHKHDNPGPPSPPIGFVPSRSGQRPSGRLSPGSSDPCGRVLRHDTVSGMQPEPDYVGAQDPYHYPPGPQYNPVASSPDINWPPQPPGIQPLQSRMETPIPDVPTSESWRHSPSTTTTSSISTTPVSGTEIWTGSVMTPFPNLPQSYPSSSDTGDQIQQENMFARHLANSPSYNSGSQPRTYNHLIVPPRAGGASSPQGSYHQHQRGSSFSSVRSSTPPLNTPSHTQTLVLPATALPSQLDTRIQKEALLDSSYGMQGAPFPLEDIGMFDAMRAGLEGSADPSYSSDDVGYENGNLVTLGLPISNGCEFTGATLPKSLMNPLYGAIPRYLAVYWEKVHPLLPIVHRASFENAPEEVLRYAMAAMATQFLDDEEDRVKGSRLHDLAWREVKKTLQWNIQVMQAIFLCEYFARLRGQNAVIRPSRLFEDLYKRVLYHHPTMIDYSASPSDQQLSIQASWKNWVDVEAHRRLLAACFFLDGHVAIYQQQPQLGQSSVASKLTHPPIPLMGSSLRLWEATSAAPWAKILAEDPSAGIPVFAPSPGTITPDFVSRQISIDRMIILVAEYLRIPCRQGLTAPSASAQKSSVSEVDPQLHYMNSQFSPLQQGSPCFQPDFLQPPDSRTRGSFDIEARLGSLFPGCPIASTYLALHHTPLRDLLAVSGESWLFTKKVLPAAAFGIHQRCLKAWAENYHYRQGGDANVPTDMANLSVVKAIKYAARSIVQFLSPVSPGVSRYAPVKGAATEDRSSFWGKDISDYWALYVCALIFWAFGHRARSIPTISSTIAAATDVQQQQQQQQHSAKRQRTGDIKASLTSRHGSSAAADQRAMSWLRMLGADNVTEEDIIRARSRSESMSVVSLVRRRLEVDCIGGKNMLYVEAVAVLRRLEEDGERNDKPWF